MKKIWKKIALIIALLLILGLGVFANALVGNPISKLLAKQTATKQLKEVYWDTDFRIERISYSFKDGNYYIHISSPSSIDSHFTICTNMGGKLLYDSYESRVVTRQNTADRINTEYRELVESVLKSPMVSFTSDIWFGDIAFISETYEIIDDFPACSIISETLELDKIYDVREFGKQAGVLVVYIQDEIVTIERAAELLLEIKYIMDSNDIPFYAIDFELKYPKPENEELIVEWREKPTIDILEFLYEDIYEEGLIERVKVANQETIAYYEELDNQKEMEIKEFEEDMSEYIEK